MPTVSSSYDVINICKFIYKSADPNHYVCGRNRRYIQRGRLYQNILVCRNKKIIVKTLQTIKT